jgi:signal peptidase I
MRPYARTGDAVLVKKSDKTVSPGKIVSYVSPTQAGASVIVTHRVVSVDGAAGTFTAKGDNNVSADKALPLSYVVGAVQSPVPYAGYVVDMLKRPVGLIAAVYVPCALMIIAEIRRLTRHYKGQFGRSGNANSRVGQRGRRQATRHYRLHYYFD